MPAARMDPSAIPAPIVKLFRARNEFDRLLQLTEILKHEQIDLPDFFDSPAVWSVICREANPDKLAWRLCQEIALRTGGRVPACLQPWVDRPDFAAEQRAHELEQFQSELQLWLAPPEATGGPRRDLSLVWTVRKDIIHLRSEVTIDMRAHSAKVRNGSRNYHQVRGLCQELLHRPEMFTDEDAAMLRWLNDFMPFLMSDKQKNGSPFLTDNRSLLAWLQQWGDTPPASSDSATLLPAATSHTRLHFEDGASVYFSHVPARIVPVLKADAGKNGSRPTHISIDFEVQVGEDEAVPLSEATFFLCANEETAALDIELVLARGRFYRIRERPPRKLLLVTLRNGPSRFQAASARNLLPSLLKKFPGLQAGVREHLRQIRCNVTFLFALAPDDMLNIRLQAVSLKGGHLWEWTHGGWASASPKTAIAAVRNGNGHHGNGKDKDAGAGANGNGAHRNGNGKDLGAHDSHHHANGSGHANGNGHASGHSAHHGTEEPVNPLAAAAYEAEDGDETYMEAEVVIAEPLGEVWDEVPAEHDVEGALTWLDQWGAENGDLCGRTDEPGVFLHLTGREIARVVKLWQDRSPLWKCFGNKRFQALIENKRSLFPKVKIQSTGIDWFTVKTEWEEECLKLTEEDWMKLRQTADPYVKLKDGSWISKEDAQELDEFATALADLGLGMRQEEQRVSTMQLSGSNAETWAKLERSATTSWQGELNKLRDAVKDFEGVPEIELPKGLHATLRPYQREGLNFLAYSSSLKLGAILADDMGLGKTVQALAWLQHLRETKNAGPSLVICPSSVVFNWAREAAQFTPGLRVLVLTAGTQRHSLRRTIPQHDLIITNYALLRCDVAELKKFPFSAIILDEAQYIKNPDSLAARAARSLQSDHRLALTGTPLENRLLDLWSLSEFIAPGYLPGRTHFAEQYDKDGSPQGRQRLAARMRPFILRRLKSQVARDLPDRIEERIDCELLPAQREFYLTELMRMRQAWTQLDPADQQTRIHALAALTRLRQICCHPALAGAKKNVGSGKTSAFFDLIDPLYAGGHKVLVFSQFVEMLKILQRELEAKERPYYLLTGQTTNRGKIVEDFQNDSRPAVFLLSLKAAGTGLNLTSASYVILYDPWWNPAVEAQAIDRTHRIGQDRTVIAYRLVTRDTVEEKIYQLQQHKAQLFKDVFGEQGFTSSLTMADLEFLLSDSSIPEL